MMISWDDFAKIDLRVGTIVEAEVFKEAKKPAYILKVDLGSKIGIKKSSAQITDLYQPDQLVGKQVIAVVNFPPKQIGPILSEILVTGFYSDNGVILAVPDQLAPNGLALA